MLKEANNDDENIRAIMEIENALNEIMKNNAPIYVEDKIRKIITN